MLAQAVGVTPQLVLHSQGCVQGALGVVFVRNRCAEQGEDAVAGGLRDVAAVALHRLDHQPECRIDNSAGLFRIEVLDKIHRALDVGKECGNRFALALE